jgi:hypothetical protein
LVPLSLVHRLAASRLRTHPLNARDLSEPPIRGDLGMPPSVACSQLPMHSAHATKEPPQTGGGSPFLDGCCTNSTRQPPKFRRKLLSWNMFLRNLRLLTLALRRRSSNPFFYREQRAAHRIPLGNRGRTREESRRCRNFHTDMRRSEQPSSLPQEKCGKALF